jgi:hypothetical protein
MHQVITRRFRRLLDEQARSEAPAVGSADGPDGPMLVDPETGRPRKFAYAPGLVVVDGGPPQVAAAQRALDELGVVDIAKVPGIGPTTAAAIKDAVAATEGARQTVSVTPSFNAATGEIVDDDA